MLTKFNHYICFYQFCHSSRFAHSVCQLFCRFQGVKLVYTTVQFAHNHPFIQTFNLAVKLSLIVLPILNFIFVFFIYFWEQHGTSLIKFILQHDSKIDFFKLFNFSVIFCHRNIFYIDFLKNPSIG